MLGYHEIVMKPCLQLDKHVCVRVGSSPPSPITPIKKSMFSKTLDQELQLNRHDCCCECEKQRKADGF